MSKAYGEKPVAVGWGSFARCSKLGRIEALGTALSGFFGLNEHQVGIPSVCSAQVLVL